ncbi:Large ribosomal subunit protein uL30m [Abortiporus biennis]
MLSSTLRSQALRATPRRLLSTTTSSTTSSAAESEPLTHYRITLLRSAIALPSNLKGTLTSLGIHRRLQTVYHEHSQINAGKILKVKELVKVENVPKSAVRTKTEMKYERKATRGYNVVGNKLQNQSP